MSFLNSNNCLITDSTGNIYNFQHIEKGIEVITHNKSTGKIEKEIAVYDRVLEYDVSINEDDIIYLVCQKENRSISIYSFNNYEWTESELAEEVETNIYNLKILTVKDIVHIFYCKLSIEDERKLNINHHYFENNEWNTIVVESIYKNQLINPFEIVISSEQMILIYYDLGDYTEEISIKVFDINQNEWKSKISVANDNKSKLYLDTLELGEYIHITYSEYQNENLTIRHKKIKLHPDKIEEISCSTLSNLANCTYPTLIYENNTLWNVWTEYDSVVSSYSLDEGNTWSNPFLWTESKGVDFVRYKFITNEKRLQKNYVMNYSFGRTYPDLTFLGFGELEKAVEEPKKKDGFVKESYYVEEDYFEEEDVIEMNICKELENKIVELERILKSMENRINILENSKDIAQTKDLEKKINDIETYLNRRRNPFGTRI